MTKNPKTSRKNRVTRGSKASQATKKAPLSQNTSNRGELVYGKHAVLELLQENLTMTCLYLQKGLSPKEYAPILELAREKAIPIQEVDKLVLNQLSHQGVHQGIALEIKAFPYAEDLEALFQRAKDKGEEPFFMILDSIEDPYNLGAILRTADASGVHGVIIPKRRSVGLTSTVAKASTGAIAHVPVLRVTNLSRTIQALKARHVWVFATDMEGQPYTQMKADMPIALVIGNEGRGVSRLVKEHSDGLVTIPMTGHVQSLNASVAAALLMYEVFRQR